MTVVVGFLLALLALVGTHLLDGGELGLLVQPSAALIVVGGTMAALAVQYRWEALRNVFFDLRSGDVASHRLSREETIRLFVAMAGAVHRRGTQAVLGVAADVATESSLLHTAVEMVGRGSSAEDIRTTLELSAARIDRRAAMAVEVLQAGGGFAPTMGVLGAVFGLVRIMSMVSNPDQLGSGIALAFVATIYGLGLANFVLLPLAGRMETRVQGQLDDMELVIEGACALASRDEPKLVERKLASFARTQGQRNRAVS
ncbi:MAG: motility protein A [Nannocystales bacterium]